MKIEQLRHDSRDPAHVPQEEPPPCVACTGADWREFFRLSSLHDRVVWMDQHVPSPRAAQSREELVAMPSQHRSDPTPE